MALRPLPAGASTSCRSFLMYVTLPKPSKGFGRPTLPCMAKRSGMLWLCQSSDDGVTHTLSTLPKSSPLVNVAGVSTLPFAPALLCLRHGWSVRRCTCPCSSAAASLGEAPEGPAPSSREAHQGIPYRRHSVLARAAAAAGRGHKGPRHFIKRPNACPGRQRCDVAVVPRVKPLGGPGFPKGGITPAPYTPACHAHPSCV